MTSAEPPFESELHGSPLSLSARVDVFPDVRLPEFDSDGGPAYAGQLKLGQRIDLIVILCTNKGMSPRLEIVNTLRGLEVSGILRFRDSGIIFWPPTKTYVFAVAFDKPFLPRYRTSLDGPFPTMGETAFFQHVLRPFSGILVALMRSSIVHHGIRPTNVFWQDGASTGPQLGECLSVPPGVGQPVLFEPIERALCPPLGRGLGSHADDCYAMGVLLALMALGTSPLQGLDDVAVLQQKITQGSLGAILGPARLPTTHIELLRGLLADDPKERWTGADVETWLAGRRQFGRKVEAGRRATRHFVFKGQSFWTLRPLAMAFAAVPDEAMRVLQNDSLTTWINRAIGHDGLVKQIKEFVAVFASGEDTPKTRDLLVARVGLLLDPLGPIRYRGYAMMPAGLPALLAMAVQQDVPVHVFEEILAGNLPTLWLSLQTDTGLRPEIILLGQAFERARKALERKSFSQIREIVMYDLNPFLECLSPIVAGQYVVSVGRVLAALEHVAEMPSAQRPGEPLDWHLVAFLLSRDRKEEPSARVLSMPTGSVERSIMLLKLLADLQERHGPTCVPALATWMLTLVEPALLHVINRPLREKLRREATHAASQGDLKGLLMTVANPVILAQDAQNFTEAKQLYNRLKMELTNMGDFLTYPSETLRTSGEFWAAVIACFFAVGMTLFVLVHAFV